MHIIRQLLKPSTFIKRSYNTYTKPKHESEPLINSIKSGFGFGIGLIPSLTITYFFCVTNTKFKTDIIYDIKE